ncbi:MAG: HAD-IIIC family phosphatase [Planctomycetota bacterium]
MHCHFCRSTSPPAELKQAARDLAVCADCEAASAAPGDACFQWSRFLVRVDVVPSWSFVSHGVFGRRRIVDRVAMRLLERFAQPASLRAVLIAAVAQRLVPAWATDNARSGEEILSRVTRWLRELIEDELLVDPSVGDEASAIQDQLLDRYGEHGRQALAVAAIEDDFAPVTSTLDRGTRGDVAPNRGPLSVLLLGWCFTQAIKPALRAHAAERGYDARIETGFQDDLYLIESAAPDVCVLQLGHRQLLAPLFAEIIDPSGDSLDETLRRACDLVTESVARAAARLDGRLLLVQGIAAPQTSPLGALDFRSSLGVAEVFARLNAAARAAIRPLPNALFVDEEELFASYGKRSLLDDLAAPFAHHGTRERPGAWARAHALLAAAYLDHYELWRGTEAIRCVVVDLDDTLWPGEIAAEDFSFEREEMAVALTHGQFGGLHEALGILRRRGVLLCVLSRNEESLVRRKWRPELLPVAFGVSGQERRLCLGPDDFVVLDIGWEPKGARLAALAARLDLPLRQLAFIDDSPVEREEVRQLLPDVWVVEARAGVTVREQLLRSPRLQSMSTSAEARARTTTTRARLERDAALAAAPHRQAFLRSIGVSCAVRREIDASRCERLAELLRRTSQFNTTGRTWRASELAALIARPDAAVIALEVRDRFADYGLAALAVREGTTVVNFVVSCRVLGLEVEIVLLRELLAGAVGAGGVLEFPFVATERNAPARRLFTHAGFAAASGSYCFDLAQPLPALADHIQLAR